MLYKGSCHCGNVAYEIEGELKGVMECNCSMCSRKAAKMWFVPRPQLKVTSDESKTREYRFNKHVISHRFCPTCGASVFGMAKNKDGADMVAVNIRCLPDLDLGSVKRVPFDGASR